LRVLTFRVNGWPASTDAGASVISRVGFFSCGPTSPNAVDTHRLPVWKPSCGSNVLSLQSLARISRPLTVLPAVVPALSSALEIWVTPMIPPKTTRAPAAAKSRRRLASGAVAARRVADLRMRDTSGFSVFPKKHLS
jgi:hypothetical protein